jgi:pseudouridylate synthase
MTVHGLLNRSDHRSVALETTLLLHGVPSDSAPPLAKELGEIVRSRGATPTLIAVINGVPTVGVTDDELESLLAADRVAKANTSNLGILLHQRAHAATTVSTTMELAAAAGVRVFATGGLGGAHQGFGQHWDVSADLLAFTRFPVAVVTSGCKSILDVVSTREMLETLGVPVVGFRTDRFPAFYRRESAAGVDAVFESADELTRFVAFEMKRTGRGVVIANPIPLADEIPAPQWDAWLDQARRSLADRDAPSSVLASSHVAPGVVEPDPAGRDATPQLLAALHRMSGGATLRANLALVKSNARVAADLARSLADS